MNHGSHNITSPRSFAMGLYGFLTLNVILICIFLINLMPGFSPTVEVTNITAVEKARTPQNLVSEKTKDQIRKAKEDKNYKILFENAQDYIKNGDAADDMFTKMANYDMALSELSQIARRPKYQREINPSVKKLQKELMNFSTLETKIGDTQEKLEQIYKAPDKVTVLEKYFPKGSMKYAYYDKLGLRFGLNKKRIYSIKFESNYTGIFHGIQINDSIHKIKRILPGRIVSLSGGNYGFQELDRKTTYLFVDNDDLVDGIEQFDKAIYGKWSTIFK